ncbi:60S ribosomal protein L35 [Chionoecetes opilio]|uniref:Large ribosomal subunit protein uL29 n=1 Tax=Chionoecetes opilio TaxID=41210 RepID=A0A8J4XTG7_CHIOP|nr:60S ribosomal protein L35 [Chionoecetes opilio]
MKSEAQVKVKCSDLRNKKKDELLKQLEELKQELSGLRVAKVTGGAASKLSKILEVLVMPLEALHEEGKPLGLEVSWLKTKVQNKKFKPLDLRPKKTRSIRRALTRRELQIMTPKESKRRWNFPMRKYAVKA